PQTKSARVKSPGAVWTYPTKDVKVEYLTLPADALKALTDHAADPRNMIAEGLAYVPIDAESAKLISAMSGKAIEALRARQFDRCDRYRDDFGNGWIMPVTSMVLRVSRARRVAFPAVAAARDARGKYVANDNGAPMLFVRWPDGYLQP